MYKLLKALFVDMNDQYDAKYLLTPDFFTQIIA